MLLTPEGSFTQGWKKNDQYLEELQAQNHQLKETVEKHIVESESLRTTYKQAREQETQWKAQDDQSIAGQ